ncbi:MULTISPECIES: cytochrome P450 [Spongiibacter]|uniref:cytochrome P450 n=1 Tax=Spongiibacter TaxID=630749 RepID=UPI001B13BEC0|nr:MULTISPECIES: cytochrome P450 [Spongiibacter]MBO6754510.1 cytochrome P450 [Spongiibacter sp.]|tara:strand:+ start:39484 stop:40731 length:1248 start_codon:yes stop_codon:yes gene_type:complete
MSQCPHVNLLSLDAYVGGMPYEELAKVRQQGSMVYMDDPENGVPYWAVVKRDALDFVSQHPELFSSNLKGAFPMEVPPEEVEIQAVMQENIIIAMDPPKHMKYRKILRDAFTPKAVADMESWLRKGARQIVDRVAKKGRCEFVEEVAAELPLMAILELLGVPQEDRKQFFDWTNTMTFADDPDVATTRDEANAASFEVIAYAAELAAKQRENPTSPVVQALLNGEVDGEPVTEEMFAWMFILIMVGGNESTRTATSHGMRLLIEHPDQLQHLVDHPEDIPDAIEEMLRYNTAFIAMRRTATQDVEWNGHHIKKGDKVVLHYHAVNHDEDVFGDDALRFDIHRAKRMPSMRREIRSFGIGEHFCLGMNLARMELKVIFEELIPRLRNPEFAGEVRYMRSFFINTIKAMPIRFDPEE